MQDSAIISPGIIQIYAITSHRSPASVSTSDSDPSRSNNTSLLLLLLPSSITSSCSQSGGRADRSLYNMPTRLIHRPPRSCYCGTDCKELKKKTTTPNPWRTQDAAFPVDAHHLATTAGLLSGWSSRWWRRMPRLTERLALLEDHCGAKVVKNLPPGLSALLLIHHHLPIISRLLSTPHPAIRSRRAAEAPCLLRRLLRRRARAAPPPSSRRTPGRRWALMDVILADRRANGLFCCLASASGGEWRRWKNAAGEARAREFLHFTSSTLPLFMMNATHPREIIIYDPVTRMNNFTAGWLYTCSAIASGHTCHLFIYLFTCLSISSLKCPPSSRKPALLCWLRRDFECGRVELPYFHDFELARCSARGDWFLCTGALSVSRPVVSEEHLWVELSGWRGQSAQDLQEHHKNPESVAY